MKIVLDKARHYLLTPHFKGPQVSTEFTAAGDSGPTMLADSSRAPRLASPWAQLVI